MTPSEQALLGAIAHEKTPQVDRSDLNPDWIPTPYVRELVQGAISLHRAGKTVNLLNLVATCRNVPREAWPGVRQIFANGYGEVDAAAAVSAVKSDYMLRVAGDVAEEIRRRSLREPGNVRAWLSGSTTRLVQLIREGYDYDARPSAHEAKPLPELLFQSHIAGMNELLRGGYRSRAFVLFAGLTKHGKSTTLISHAVDALKRGRRVSYINTEGTEQEAQARILCGLADLSWEQDVRYRQWTNLGSKDRYHQALEQVEDLLRIYDWKWLNSDRLHRVATWDRPDLIIIDYLKAQAGMFPETKDNRRFDPVGDIADVIRNEICAYGPCVLSAGQISAEAAKRVLKKEAEVVEPLYGSARPGFASHMYIMLRRGDGLHTAHYRVWLDSIGNRQNSIHEIRWNPRTWTLRMSWQEE